MRIKSVSNRPYDRTRHLFAVRPAVPMNTRTGGDLRTTLRFGRWITLAEYVTCQIAACRAIIGIGDRALECVSSGDGKSILYYCRECLASRMNDGSHSAYVIPADPESESINAD